MRSVSRILLGLATAGMLAIPPLQAAGSSSIPEPQTPQEEVKTPEQEAVEAYNRGIAFRDKAWKLEKKLGQDPAKDEKTAKKIDKAYAGAIREFTTATTNNPEFYEAFSELGYAYRRTGAYQTALEAYDRALSLEPNYTEAIEYRAEAYLGLNRLEEAKQAYDLLVRKDRKHAEELLQAMRTWVEKRRAEPGEVSVETINDFESWLKQRASADTIGRAMPKPKTEW